ncbi:TIGR04283 family arsenosugar biosynthesis glycosyltransferase [Robiginitalea sp. M366]|uniref:TIGR04283 family arsenosugar biosynthesis glycosyltransferase n=1 Tax=Robiginitalea aestuariiviva TaxID=3036903 RepID=UPI00240DCEC8|nr:TIGR04283 family arsenosugar biosynthesis glycosyltransferase [Robiginitalea aestuariiviva]MDG1571853.1 TIGR04283 family arsenosugar biosynthesis glycosyltransferase [Robiginitalea aestuariiviva]
MKGISVIIPVLEEAENLERLLPYLQCASTPGAVTEVLVVDGGSGDDSVTVAQKHGALVVESPRGRALQMNAGAARAQGDILYFLHADSLPPRGFDRQIRTAVNQGYGAGCFRLAFDHPSSALRVFAWFTRLNWALCRGGDQSLFVRAEVFRDLQGYNPRFVIYEDNELIGRIRRRYRFRVIPDTLVTSARKYEIHGVWRLQAHFGIIHLLRALGASPERLYRYYRKYVKGKGP